MPVILNNQNTVQTINAIKDELTAKYFDNNLTGSSQGTRGFFNKDCFNAETMVNVPTGRTPIQLKNGQTLSIMESTQKLMNIVKARVKSNAMLHHLVNTHVTNQKVQLDKFLPITLFTESLETLLFNNNKATALPINFKPLAVDELATDIEEIQKEEDLIAQGISIDPKDKYCPKWLKINFFKGKKANEDVAVYVQPTIENIVRVSEMFSADADPDKVKTQKSFSFSGSMKIAIISVNAKTPKNTHKLSYMSLKQLMNTTRTTTKSQANNVLKNKTIFMTRIPLLTFNTDKQNQNDVIEALNKVFEYIPSMQTKTAKNECIKQIKEATLKSSVDNMLKRQANGLDGEIKTHLIQMLDVALDKLNAKDINQESFEGAVYEALQLAMILVTLNEEAVTTDDFSEINQKITDIQQLLNVPQSTFNSWIATNLRLMLANNLNGLNQAKMNGELYEFNPLNTKVTADYLKKADLSISQKSVVLSKEPLIVVSAGAGSGKSHTLVNRLGYLNEQGEDLSKVLVLSFTNVASENIAKRYPDVKSLTLGNMFNQIYQNTFVGHKLSQSQTFKNALGIINLDSPAFANMDRDYMNDVREEFMALMGSLNQTGYRKINLSVITTQIAKFVTENFIAVVTLMNAIRQTTLDLQPILIHVLMLNDPSKLVIPNEYQNMNFILTDESQDISTFEYVLLLKMSELQKANLMITGDGSQTLYQFRNSDPRFLNAIEASSVFKAYRLSTNYRSQQAILMYANQFLQVIEANRYAQIQLTSNRFSSVDKPTFNQAVKVSTVSKCGGHDETISEIGQQMLFNSELNAWLKERIQNNEQVAVLAFKHRELEGAIEGINHIVQNQLMLDLEVQKLSPTRKRPKCDISTIVEKHADELKQTPLTADFINAYKEMFEGFVIARFKNRDNAFVPNYVKKALNKMFNEPLILMLLSEVLNGKEEAEKLFSILTRYLIDFEIRLNSTINLINANDNSELDVSKIPLVASTIHSAKGLEFEHCLIIYDETMKNGQSQEMLRLFGVALTRAKKSEFILNMVKPPDKNGVTKRIVTDQLSSMYLTPMETAKLRTYNDIKNLQNQQPIITSFNEHIHEEDHEAENEHNDASIAI